MFKSDILNLELEVCLMVMSGFSVMNVNQRRTFIFLNIFISEKYNFGDFIFQCFVQVQSSFLDILSSFSVVVI